VIEFNERDVQRLGSTPSAGLRPGALAGCRRRHSFLASSSSVTCGAVAPKFILGSDSLRARCPKRRNSRSDISCKRLRSSSGLSGLRPIFESLQEEETGGQDSRTCQAVINGRGVQASNNIRNESQLPFSSARLRAIHTAFVNI
jgi:hypothetical protein